MAKKYIATPSRTNELLSAFGLTAKKSLGQNFLMEPNILGKMMAAGGIDKTTDAIEIGPGIGALTEFLALYGRRVLAFEIDQRLLPVLDLSLADYDNVEIIHGDILEAELKDLIPAKLPDSNRLAVVANLPYYITTPIIFQLLESQLAFDVFVLMMQKEVAERLTAQVGTKAYGSLTIAIQYYCDSKIAFTVPKTVFKPQPNVDSAILKLTRLDNPRVEVADQAFFFELVRSAFVQRRKTLWNNLRAAYGLDQEKLDQIKFALEQSRIDPKRRAETLTIDEFAILADHLVDQGFQAKA